VSLKSGLRQGTAFEPSGAAAALPK